MAWDVETLKEHFDQRLLSIEAAYDKRFAAQEKAVETAFEAAKEAVIKSETGVEKRSDAVYVTISKLQDALAILMPRSEAEQRYEALGEKMSLLTDRMNTNDGSTKGSQLTAGKLYAAIGAAAAVLGIVVLVVNSVFK